MHLERYYDGFSTERLTFRKLTLDDVEEWKSFYEDNPSIFYLNINTDLSPEAMAEEWIQIQLDRYAANQYGQLAIVLKETGKLLGTRGFRLMSIDGEEELFTMCSILKPYWRQGYGTEGAVEFFNYIFDHNQAESIQALTHTHNERSQQYLQSLGFKRQADKVIENRTAYAFELKKEDWQKAQKA